MTRFAVRCSLALGLPLMLGGCMTAGLIECAFIPKPDPPSPLRREFPFTVEFEIHGQAAVHRDVQVCEYAGVSRGPDCSASHYWKEHLASGAAGATIFQSPDARVEYITEPCEILVSSYRAPMRPDAFMTDARGKGRHLDERELMEQYGIRITGFTQLRPE